MLVTKLLNCSAGLQCCCSSAHLLLGVTAGQFWREKFQHRSGIFFRMENANVSVGVGKNILLLPPVSKIGWEVKTRLVFNVPCLSLALVLFA